MEERNWAGLPAELLISITDRLPVPDKARFPAVCTSWLSAVKDFPSKSSISSSSHFPWLALIPVNPNAPLSFINRTEDQRRYHVPLTSDLLLQPLSYLGQKDGWLAVRFRDDVLASVILFNPLTGARSHLPSLSKLDDYNITINFRIVLSASPSSTASFVAIVAFGSYGLRELAFARPGDDEWTPLHTLRKYKDDVEPIDMGIMDVVHHDDKFFAIFTNGHLLSFDLTGPSPQVSVIGTGKSLDGGRHRLSPSFRILVSAPSSGELLQIRRRRYWDDDPEEYNIFDVVKFDMKMDGWVDTSDLVGNWSLFLDEKGSMLLSDVPGQEGNYVFFIDSHPGLQHSCVSKVSVYDMGKGTVEPCFRDDTEFNRSIFMHLIWLRPSLS